jgi:hypothetical protein
MLEPGESRRYCGGLRSTPIRVVSGWIISRTTDLPKLKGALLDLLLLLIIVLIILSIAGGAFINPLVLLLLIVVLVLFLGPYRGRRGRL